MKTRLTAKEITNKEFDAVLQGYNPQDVDDFLDGIVADYHDMITKINEQEKQNFNLKNTLEGKKEDLKTKEQEIKLLIDQIDDMKSNDFAKVKRLMQEGFEEVKNLINFKKK